MPRAAGHDKNAIETRNKIDTIRFNLITIKDTLEIVLKLLKQGISWIDWEPLWLTSAVERVEETMKLIDEVMEELKG